ncbi:uncharacterized protein BP5553_09333 [Venustampulla echinocandica]|uniref:Uncharacterized protein n=1 Tax=Venustampulla echinocandica TaxID=2656787 RepID=A0A370TCH9_9HELO|nr:uncharacterized protein BP5553_09333 [Venustampulla echinocandica]RDL31931.1 hypothetical protein BP5553_09333 [Venustampulla echinocandica]
MKSQRSNRRLLRKLGHTEFWSKKLDATLGEGGHGNHKIDESTGQVYTETTASIQSTDDREWTHKPRLRSGQCVQPEASYHEYIAAEGLDQEDAYSKSAEYIEALKDSGVKCGRGTRSLKDLSVECILNNITYITLEGMQCLPLHLVQLIWDSISNRCLLSFHAWVIFSKLLHQNEGAVLGLLRYRHAIETPKSPLQMYSTSLTSSSFDFISSLSITTTFPLPDLVRLSKITNLGVLEIINVPGTEARPAHPRAIPGAVSDRLIRAWHFAALNEGAFKVLRILKLWHYVELSSKSMVYLNSFPALALYDVRGCSFDSCSKIDAKRFGWKATINENVLHLLESACVERAMLMRANLGAEAKPLRRASARQLRDGSKTRRIPRSEVPSFLTRPEALVPGGNHEKYSRGKETADIVARSSFPKESVTRHRRGLMNSVLSDASTSHETWEFSTYTSFARIGELRNDADLSRAGVSVGDQVLVQNELVNSVPIVSLRLGETPSDLRSCSNMSRLEPLHKDINYGSSNSPFKYTMKNERDRWIPRALAFIRIKLPPVEVRSEVLSVDSAQQELKCPAEAAIPDSTKCHGINVRRSKKRNIGDMLSSFN